MMREFGQPYAPLRTLFRAAFAMAVIVLFIWLLRPQAKVGALPAPPVAAQAG